MVDKDSIKRLAYALSLEYKLPPELLHGVAERAILEFEKWLLGCDSSISPVGIMSEQE